MKKNVRLQALVSEDEHQEIKVWSAQNKTSISELIIQAVNEHFERNEVDIRITLPQWGGTREKGQGDT